MSTAAMSSAAPLSSFQHMGDAELLNLLIDWISQDRARMQALEWAAQCAAIHSMPQWYLAAGFVRNLVWDRLHGYGNQNDDQGFANADFVAQSESVTNAGSVTSAEEPQSLSALNDIISAPWIFVSSGI